MYRRRTNLSFSPRNWKQLKSNVRLRNFAVSLKLHNSTWSLRLRSALDQCKYWINRAFLKQMEKLQKILYSKYRRFLNQHKYRKCLTNRSWSPIRHWGFKRIPTIVKRKCKIDIYAIGRLWNGTVQNFVYYQQLGKNIDTERQSFRLGWVSVIVI